MCACAVSINYVMQRKFMCTLAEQKQITVKSSQSQSKKVHRWDHNQYRYTKPVKRGNLRHLGPSASRQKFKTPGPSMMISVSTQTRSPQPAGRSAKPKHDQLHSLMIHQVKKMFCRKK